MTREEAVEYLKQLHSSVDICYACGECGCGLRDECKLEQVIEYLDRDGMERLKEVLREVRGEI